MSGRAHLAAVDGGYAPPPAGEPLGSTKRDDWLPHRGKVVTVTRGEGETRRTYEGKLSGVAPSGAFVDVTDKHAGGKVRLPLDGQTRLRYVAGKRP